MEEFTSLLLGQALTKTADLEQGRPCKAAPSDGLGNCGAYATLTVGKTNLALIRKIRKNNEHKEQLLCKNWGSSLPLLIVYHKSSKKSSTFRKKVVDILHKDLLSKLCKPYNIPNSPRPQLWSGRQKFRQKKKRGFPRLRLIFG